MTTTKRFIAGRKKVPWNTLDMWGVIDQKSGKWWVDDRGQSFWARQSTAEAKADELNRQEVEQFVPTIANCPACGSAWPLHMALGLQATFRMTATETSVDIHGHVVASCRACGIEVDTLHHVQPDSVHAAIDWISDHAPEPS